MSGPPRPTITPVALTIAGSDPSGGAGIGADLKTFHQHGVYGASVLTLVTVQNTVRVSEVETLRPELVRAQLEAVLDDLPPQAAKTGALGTREVIEAVADALHGWSFPLVVDPVMISKHGAPLLAAEARGALCQRLLPRALLVTPNLAEAAALAGMDVADPSAMAEAARRIAGFGVEAVLVKGGHLAGAPVDVLWRRGEIEQLEGPRIGGPAAHGTGCAYSAAITAHLARGVDLLDAIRRAKRWVTAAIASRPALGRGFGPLNHQAPTE